MRKILILGGYGNFGKRIAQALVKDDVPVIIAGRNKQKAHALVEALGKYAEISIFDVNQELPRKLKKLNPVAVINTCGPFQMADYTIADICIENGVHYIDLADSRDFVTGITTLDAKAKKKRVSVITGASTVPGLSSAVLENYKDAFSEIESLAFGISPGQQAERGLATTKGILSYIGKPLKPFSGHKKPLYGWQDLHRQTYPELGKRWMANCDIPDLDLLPKKYGIKKIRFSAGMELTVVHLGIWFLSWLVRLGLPLNLPRYAPFLLNLSNWFDYLGTAAGGMHMIISGKDKAGKPYERKWFIIAKDGDGPYIPTIPAIILAKKLASGQFDYSGASTCLGMVTYAEYLKELEEFSIKIYH